MKLRILVVVSCGIQRMINDDNTRYDGLYKIFQQILNQKF